MSPDNKIKLNILRKKLDKLDYELLKSIKKRSEIIKKVITLKSYKNEIVDKKKNYYYIKENKKRIFKKKYRSKNN